MKTITKERLIKALDKAAEYLEHKPEIHIVTTLGKIGMRAAIYDAFGNKENPITDKDRLELAYQGFRDPDKIMKRLSHWKSSSCLDGATDFKEAWLNLFNKTIERHWQRQERILSIQAANNVSGLIKTSVDFGGKVVEFYEQDEQLNLLEPNDYIVMHSERMMIAREFIKATKRHGMTLYKREKEINEWSKAKPSDVLLHTLEKIWVKAWEYKGSGEQEFNLVTGSGLYPDSDLRAVWFCSRSGKSQPSL